MHHEMSATMWTVEEMIRQLNIHSLGTASAVVVLLFLAGLWFTGAIINGPNFYQKLTLEAPTIGYMRLMLTGPSWLLTVRPARQPLQDAVLPRRMTTTALGTFGYLSLIGQLFDPPLPPPYSTLMHSFFPAYFVIT